MMARFSEPTGQDWKKTGLLLVLYIIFITVTAVALISIDELYGFIAWLILVLGGLLLLVGWVNHSYGYRCKNCIHEFEISLFTSLITPHGMGWKYLKCPQCGKRTKAKVLKKEQQY